MGDRRRADGGARQGHRPCDLKPANVMLTRENCESARLRPGKDAGRARENQIRDDRSDGIGRHGNRLCRRSRRKPDHRSDVFSRCDAPRNHRRSTAVRHEPSRAAVVDSSRSASGLPNAAPGRPARLGDLVAKCLERSGSASSHRTRSSRRPGSDRRSVDSGRVPRAAARTSSGKQRCRDRSCACRRGRTVSSMKALAQCSGRPADRPRGQTSSKPESISSVRWR